MNEKITFLPFHAINEFMLPDYQKHILRTVFANINQFGEDTQKEINVLSRKLLKIQGFKNSVQAPLNLKVNAAIPAFEKSPQFVAVCIYAWQNLNQELANKVWDLLTQRSWILLPVEADRRKLPGFMIEWPEQDPFEVLTSAFHEMFPDGEESEYDITLMMVWLSTRLPYEMVSKEDIFKPKN